MNNYFLLFSILLKFQIYTLVFYPTNYADEEEGGGGGGGSC